MENNELTPEQQQWMKIHRRNELGRLVYNADQVLGTPILTSKEWLEENIGKDINKQIEWLEARIEKMGIQLKPAWFGFDDGPIWPGFTTGQTWNGWACPMFTKEVADQIIQNFNNEASEVPRSYYDEAMNGYFIGWELQSREIDDPNEPLETYCWKATKDGYYPLGAGSWTWNIYEEEEEIIERKLEALPPFMHEVYEAAKYLSNALNLHPLEEEAAKIQAALDICKDICKF